jgi:hypothetical protein
MIGMPIGQQDRVDLTNPAPCGLDGTCHLVGPPGNPSVHQHHPVVDDDVVCVHGSDRTSITPSTTSRMSSLWRTVAAVGLSQVLGVSDRRSCTQLLPYQRSDLSPEELDRSHGLLMINVGHMQLETIDTHQLMQPDDLVGHGFRPTEEQCSFGPNRSSTAASDIGDQPRSLPILANVWRYAGRKSARAMRSSRET